MDWVERFPDRFEHELADFARRGLAFELDEQLLRQERRVVLRGLLAVEGEPDPVDLLVAYPDSFPFFRPEVYAPKLQLDRHQNPFDRNLCLLDRSTRAWSPSETAAHLVVSQVPLLLRLVREGGKALHDGEVPQGEPVSYYLPPLVGTVVFIPEELLQLPREHRTGVAKIAFGETEPPAIRVRGLLESAAIRERRGRTRRLARASGKLSRRFGASSIEARWIRLDGPPASRDPQQLLAQAEAAAPGLTAAQWQPVRDGAVAVTALVYDEEVGQDQTGDAWLFVVGIRESQARGQREGWYLTRGERLGRSDLNARIPALAPLGDRRVALIGLGALGAPIALELARAQLGELRILDFDLVEAGTIVRWPFGLSAVAAPKPEFLAQVIPREYPFTKVTAFNRMIGQVPQGRRETDFDLLTRMLRGVDLVIDASAEIGVQQIVAYVADEMRIPQLTVSATEGARGGVVARSTPGESGCWHCLQAAFDREEIELPPHEETAMVQPRGCGSRTFTGASFDLLPIIAQAMRVATTTLVHGRLGADIFVCSLAGEDGAPSWKTSTLEKRVACPGCGIADAA
jgi:molybdopterin/thiamine biosynthesis adenylyltransferase